MDIYIVFVFNRSNYPSTTEYLSAFRLEKDAQEYVKSQQKKRDRFEEVYYEKKVI